MRDFNGIIGKIGKESSKTIPHPESTDDYNMTYESLANYLTLVNFIKNGIHRNNTDRTGNKIHMGITQENLVPIFDTQGRLRIHLAQKTIQRLLFAQRKMTQEIEKPENFEKIMSTLVRTHQLSSISAGWKLDTNILRTISKEFDLTTEHYKNPITHDTVFEHYTSTYKEDEQFGANYTRDNEIWSEHSFVNGITMKRKIRDRLETAVKSSLKNNTNTVLLLPDNDDGYKQYMTNDGPYLHKIITWDEGLTFSATINEKRTKMIQEKIHLYIISHENTIHTSHNFKTKLMTISEKLYGYTPTYHMKTDINTTKEKKTHKKKNRHRHPKTTKLRDVKIGKYMLKNTLRALGIKKVNDLMRKIKRKLKEEEIIEEKRHTLDRITEREVDNVKLKLNRFIISALDKNEGQLYVE